LACINELTRYWYYWKWCEGAAQSFRAIPIRRAITYFTQWPMLMPKPL